MPPASNQLLTWNDIAAEVSAGRMVWKTSAQSGLNLPNYQTFGTYIAVSNLAAFANNNIPNYSQLLTVVVTALPVTGLTAADAIGFGKANATWSLPSGGPFDSVRIQWHDGINHDFTLSGSATSHLATGLAAGFVDCEVWVVKTGAEGPHTLSNSVEID